METLKIPTKLSNITIVNSLEHMARMAKNRNMQSHLYSVLAEICEDFHFCPVCLDELQSRDDFDKGYKHGWWCSNCEKAYKVN